MSGQHPYRETISAIPDGVTRPLWSVMIPTYNCANYLRETLGSVLAQDPGSDVMQIEVVDDYSTKDDPKSVVEELGKGRVDFYRHPENVGYIKNFNTCIQRARGKLVHLLHGDDCVREGFYEKMQQPLVSDSSIGAAFCRYIYMDDHSHWQQLSSLEQPESGILNNWLDRIAVKQLIQPPSMVVRRSVYEALGGFDSRICCCAEDWEMWVRIAAQYPVWYETSLLALYRIQSKSLTGRCAHTGQNIRDIIKILDITQSYIPSSKARLLSQQARNNFSSYYLNSLVPSMIERGNLVAAMNQLKELVKLNPGLETYYQAIYLSLKALKYRLKLSLNASL
jgi:glycosyltransferase involved in cell wall biosynthesis